MPLIDCRLKPGQWRIEKIGASGKRYRLQFEGSRFQALSRLEEYKPMPNKPLYWRRIYTAYKNNRAPHGKLTVGGFEDIGIVGKTKIAAFIAGQHAQVVRGEPSDPWQFGPDWLATVDAKLGEATPQQGYRIGGYAKVK